MKTKEMSAKKELELFHRIAHIISSTIDLTELLREISKMLVLVLKVDSCLIYLYDEHRASLVLSGAHNPHPGVLGRVKMKMGEGITGWVAAHEKPVVISTRAYDDPRFKFFSSLQEDKYESFCSMPILLKKGQITGVMNLQTERVRNYSPGEIKLLGSVSKLMAGCIENAKLFLETKRNTKQIETLSQVSRLIAGKSYLDELLRLIVSITAESLGFRVCSVMLLDQKKNELSICATQSLSEEYRNKPAFKVEESLCGQAVTSKKPVEIYDVREEPAYRYPEIAKQEGFVSMLSVPMLVKDHCIGVLNSYTQEAHHFSDSEITMLASVAHQAAIAIENTQLMQRAMSTEEELATRKVVERAKGLLMAEKNVSEREAFKEIQKTAMDKRKTMKEIAEAILLSSEIKSNR